MKSFYAFNYFHVVNISLTCKSSVSTGFYRWPAGIGGAKHADGGREGARNPSDCAVNLWSQRDI